MGIANIVRLTILHLYIGKVEVSILPYSDSFILGNVFNLCRKRDGKERQMRHSKAERIIIRQPNANPLCFLAQASMRGKKAKLFCSFYVSYNDHLHVEILEEVVTIEEHHSFMSFKRGF